jgi:hypothetical protein
MIRFPGVACRIIVKSKLLLVLLGIIAPIELHGSEFSSAQFGQYKGKFIERLSLPELEDGSSLIVRCATNISARGRFSYVICYENLENINLSKRAARTIRKTARKSKIEPAVVDAKRVKVWYSFSVLYRQQ